MWAIGGEDFFESGWKSRSVSAPEGRGAALFDEVRHAIKVGIELCGGTENRSCGY